MFVILTDSRILGRPLGVTLGRHCPEIALVAVLLKAVPVVPELPLECLDGLLVLNHRILALLPLLLDLHQCVVQHTVLLLQVLVLVCVGLLAIGGLRLQNFVLLPQVGRLLLVLQVLLLTRSAACGPDRLLGF